MNLKTLRLAIKLLPPKKSIMLKGVHGIGKTEWTIALAKELGLKLIIWHASHAADATDITGMPKIVKETIVWFDKNGKKHEEVHDVSVNCPPKWMLQKEPVLLLLDEINRGLTIALNAIMQLTNDQTFDDIALPEGSRIIACINPDDAHGYSVTSMDPAQMSRFVVYPFDPTTDEWIEEYAIPHNVHPAVIAFIKANDCYLDPYTLPELAESCVGQDAIKLPDRRGWVCVSDLLYNGEAVHAFDGPTGILDLTEMVAGIVGVGAADKFAAFYADQKNALNPAEIMQMKKIDQKTIKTLQKLCSEDCPSVVAFMQSCQLFLESHQADLNKASDAAKLWANNFYALIDCLQPDVKVSVNTTIIVDAIKRKKAWAIALCRLNSAFKELAWSAMSLKKKDY